MRLGKEVLRVLRAGGSVPSGAANLHGRGSLLQLACTTSFSHPPAHPWWIIGEDGMWAALNEASVVPPRPSPPSNYINSGASLKHSV